MTETELRAALESVPHPGRLAFAASILERLLPVHDAHVETRVNGGSVALARHCVDIVWRAAAGDVLDEASLRKLLKRLALLAPGDDGDLIGASALSVTAALESGFHAICDPDGVAWVVDVSVRVFDVIDLFIQLRDDLDASDREALEKTIAADPLMQAEVRRQEQAMALLRERGVSPEVLDALRAEAAGAPAVSRSEIKRISGEGLN